MATEDMSLKIPAPSSTEGSGKDYTEDSKEKCFGLKEGNLRQRQDQNQSSYFHPNSSEQRRTEEKGFLLVV